MKAVVVYESHWGNTEAIARAVAAGFGPEAEALTTDQASGAVLLDADLVVAGAPLIAFGLPSDKMRGGIAAESAKAPTPPDLPIGVALLIGTLEFVGPNEKDGWPLAGTIVPIAYIAWSLWLVALGVFLLL
jgi:hypothetical protein